MRVRTSDLLVAGMFIEMMAVALRLAVLLLGVAVWVAGAVVRWVIWPLVRMSVRSATDAVRRVWGVHATAPPATAPPATAWRRRRTV